MPIPTLPLASIVSLAESEGPIISELAIEFDMPEPKIEALNAVDMLLRPMTVDDAADELVIFLIPKMLLSSPSAVFNIPIIVVPLPIVDEVATGVPEITPVRVFKAAPD